MTVYDLNREQLIELKQNYLAQLYDMRGETPSYGELADADSIVSDEEMIEEYAGTTFSPDDFACSAGEDRIYPYYVIVIGDGRNPRLKVYGEYETEDEAWSAWRNMHPAITSTHTRQIWEIPDAEYEKKINLRY